MDCTLSPGVAKKKGGAMIVTTDLLIVVIATALTLFCLRKVDAKPEHERHVKTDKAAKSLIGKITPRHEKDHLVFGIFFAMGMIGVLLDVLAGASPWFHHLAESILQMITKLPDLYDPR